MDGPESNIDRLIKARAEIDDKLRQHKSAITVLFTDVVGSTAYFERHGYGRLADAAPAYGSGPRPLPSFTALSRHC